MSSPPAKGATAAGLSPHALANLTLLLVACIWGASFIFQRSGAASVPAFTFTAVRFSLSCAALLPIVMLRKRAQFSLIPKGMLLGILLFGGSVFQQAGMAWTTAGKAGFITGTYVVFIPLLSYWLFRDSISRSIWVSAVVTLVGLFILSVGFEMTLSPGDLLVFICAIIFAGHIMMVSRVTYSADPFVLCLIQCLTCAVLSAAAAFIFENPDVDAVYAQWQSFAYLSVASTAIGFTLQVIAQRFTSASEAGIIMSMEAAFAMFFGYLLLDEELSVRQLIGAALMLAGFILAQLQGRMPAESDKTAIQTNI